VFLLWAQDLTMFFGECAIEEKNLLKSCPLVVAGRLTCNTAEVKWYFEDLNSLSVSDQQE